MIQKRMMIVIILASLALILMAGCTEQGNTTESRRLVVAVTIPPQEEMVRAVAGDRVDVLVLVPPGSDPHTYEPSPQQLEQASRASLYLTLGSVLPVEDTLSRRLPSLNPGLVVVDTSAGVEFLGEGASRDPHIWLSPGNAVIMVGHIKDALIMADPSNETAYRAGAGDYIRQIEDLNHTISGSFAGKENRTVMVSHPAWAYFARDYNLTIISIEEEGKEPTPGELAALVERSRESGVTVIFADALEPRRNAEVIAAEIGATVETVNPLAPDYLANLDWTARLFTRSLPG
jgi:zinc transport system substrate-binding protein